MATTESSFVDRRSVKIGDTRKARKSEELLASNQASGDRKSAHDSVNTSTHKDNSEIIQSFLLRGSFNSYHFGDAAFSRKITEHGSYQIRHDFGQLIVNAITLHTSFKDMCFSFVIRDDI